MLSLQSFLREGRVVGPCREKLKPKGPKGPQGHDRQEAGGGSSQDVCGPTSGQVEDDHVNGGS